MKKKSKKNFLLKQAASSILVIIGGSMGILFVSLFFQAPPSKADFEKLKNTNQVEHRYIISLFKTIKDDLQEIKKVLYAQALKNKNRD